MKKILIMAIAAFTIAFTSNAQTQRQIDPAKKEVRDHSRKMQYASLELTQAQKDQLKKMREANKVQKEAIKNDNALTEAQKSEKMKSLHKSQKKGMNSLLTKEQKDKMQMQRKSNSSKKGLHSQRGKSAMANLDLTPAQKDQFKKMRDDHKVQRDAIKNDKNLSDVQRGEKMKELNKSQKVKMNTILTKEQQQKMKAQRKDHNMKGNKMHGHRKNSAPAVS